jgi:DNA sulfur modification protein DndD
MILHRVTLENVGVYRGRHAIDLTPPDAERPVVLVGAMNGAGKTTLLGAVQLALYGARARGIERTRKGYKTHLKELINRSVDPAEGAAVELEFERRIDGNPVRYKIRRGWCNGSSEVSEMFQVECNGEPDALLAEHWDESIDSFLPARLSHLFFFDGEQIERMADEEEATKLLASAFQSLLGLDLVERLKEDLVTLERRKRLSLRSPEDQARIKALQDEVTDAQERCQKTHDTLAEIKAKHAQKGGQLDKLREKFKQDGGEHFLKREEREKQRGDLAAKLLQAEESLREIVAGPAPFLLIPDLLDQVRSQAEREHHAQRDRIIAEAEIQRDTTVLAELKSHLTSDAMKAVTAALEKHRPQRESLAVESVLQADEGFCDRLTELMRDDLPGARKDLEQLSAEIDRLQDEMAEVDRLLAAVPDADAVAKLQQEIFQAEGALASLAKEIANGEEQHRATQLELALRQRTLNKELEKHLDATEDSEHDQRVIEKIPKVQTTLEAFRQRVVARHIGSLEHAIYESFQHLARKPKLIGSISIASDTFRMTLLDPDGKVVPFQILSAGERQLLATAILWGLAKVSGRPVPLVIDTPLGRLDSHHRSHIVQRYFPAASHQVVLLSTDEEIIGRYLEMIRPAVGREYLLEFDDAQKQSFVKQGYLQKQ